MSRAGAARPAALIVAVVASVGCGGDSEPERTVTATGPPAADRPQPPPPPTLPIGDGAGGVKLTKIGDFDAPLYVTQPPDGPTDIGVREGGDDLYVVEQGGRIWGVEEGRVRGRPFLDISDEVTGGTEQGLLSVAFAPDFEVSRRFYVGYTDDNGDTRVVEYRMASGGDPHADPESARELLFVDQPYPNHNGGLLLFGPDGRLYIGLGDGGSAGDPERNGQDLGTLLGKILRIDPNPRGGDPYSIPSDNPFSGRPETRAEIYSYGLRNPWRFSFDRQTEALTIADVGQSAQEEVNYLPAGEAAGANFGWSAYEGTARFNSDQTAPGHVLPVHTYPYGREGACSITGGYVVRDPQLRSLYGRYLYADYCAGVLRSFVPSAQGARDDRPLGLDVPLVTSFGEDVEGRVYITSQEGPVYRLDPSG